MIMGNRDFQRQRLYDAEDILCRMFSRAQASGNPVVTINGVTLTLPPEALFGDLQSISTYAAKVLDLPAVRDRFGVTRPVTVRRRKGITKAHYENKVQGPVIAVPDQVRWAMRELVLLHELAHHLDPTRGTAEHSSHGPAFVDTLVALLELVMAPEAALAARLVFSDNDIQQHHTQRIGS